MSKVKKKFQCNLCSKFLSCQSYLTYHQANHLKKKTYPCAMCSKKFENASSLTHHRITAHLDQKSVFSCRICSKSFNKRQKLRIHSFSHPEEWKFQCKKCLSVFKTHGHLKRHESTHSDARAFNCQTCSKTFKYIKDLTIHQLVHSEIKPWSCNICPSSCRTTTELRNHIRIHHSKLPEVKFRCYFCLKESNTKGNLYSHLRMHTLEKYQKCNWCEKSFLRMQELTHHREIRHPKPNESFMCEVCDKQFLSKLTFQTHQKVHKNFDKFQCRFCFKTFPFRAGLESHIATHTQEQAYKCEICMKGYSLKSKLNYHLKKHHNQIKKSSHCYFCKARFPNPSELKLHLVTHTRERPYHCQLCNAVFSRMASAYNHRSTIHESNRIRHNCNFCMKSFVGKSGLSNHLKRHLNERPYECNLCQKTYVNASRLKFHMQGHFLTKINFQNHRLGALESFNKLGCIFCPKSFPSPVELRNHLSSHTNQIVDTLSCCGMDFNTREDLDRHVKGKSHVNVGRTVPCYFCPQKRQSFSKLVIHLTKHTQERPFRCNLCHGTFTSKQSLLAHMKIHGNFRKTFNCYFCPKTFIWKFSRGVHYRRDHLNEHICSCELCKKTFLDSKDLKYHIKSRRHKIQQLRYKCQT